MLSPRGSQPDFCFFSFEDKQKSEQIEDSDPEVEISTIVVIKWSDVIQGPRVKVNGPLCGGLFKEDCWSIVYWSGIDPYE